MNGAAPGPGAARLDPPRAVHRVGEAALLAEYPGTAEVLAAAAAVRELAPAHLVDLVPAERTLLLAGTAAQDLPAFTALLAALPAPTGPEASSGEVSVGIVYDGEDLHEIADLLGMSTQALIAAHSTTPWRAAFGGFAPGFSYLLPDPSAASSTASGASAAPGGSADPDGPPWEVPRRAAPRTAVPAGAVGLASRYCGIYPRPSPGGWQLIGRSDAPLFDVDREPPSLLAPGTRVRFVPQRPTARASTSASAAALAQVAREAASATGRRGRRRPEPAGTAPGHVALEIVSAGPLALIEDTGRPGRAASGVSCSGAFDRGAMLRANLAVGNRPGAAVLEAVAGQLQLRAVTATVVALSGARAPLAVRRTDAEAADLELDPAEAYELPLALDPGDLLEVGPVRAGLRLVLAVRGGLQGLGQQGLGTEGLGTEGLGTAGLVLGSRSRDTLSGLGPDPLVAGDRLAVGPENGLDAVPTPVRVQAEGLPGAAATHGEAADHDDAGAPDEAGPNDDAATREGAATDEALEIPVHVGPRDELLGEEVLAGLLATTWRVRPDSDRVGVRLDGAPLAVPSELGTLPSEPMVPGTIQIPPSGLPVVFGPDHPTTGGYPVIAVVTRVGLDRLAQATPGTGLRFTLAR